WIASSPRSRQESIWTVNQHQHFILMVARFRVPIQLLFGWPLSNECSSGMSEMQHPELPDLIDTHCHLDYDYEIKSAEDLVREAQSNGVNTLITIGTEIPRIERIREISEKFENVYHT